MIPQLAQDFRANPNLIVYIRADKDCRYELVAQLIDGCQKNGITRYSLRTDPTTEMNRLQKKCLIATAGFHLLLLVILFVGPAFFAPSPKPDDTQVLDVIPANLIDAAVQQRRAEARNRRPLRLRSSTAATATNRRPRQNHVQPVRQRRQPTLLNELEKFFKPEPTKTRARAELKSSRIKYKSI